MIGIVYGKSGTGKSEWVFHEMNKAASKHRVFLLVPDREAVMAESRAAALPNAGNIDVLTFGRLCNYLFRTYGGLCVDYIGKGAKKLIMRNVMRAIAPMLKEYGASAEGLVPSFIRIRYFLAIWIRLPWRLAWKHRLARSFLTWL